MFFLDPRDGESQRPKKRPNVHREICECRVDHVAVNKFRRTSQDGGASRK